MKINIKDKFKKQDILIFIAIWIFAMLVNSAFLHRHYSSDAMCLIDLGYFEYPSQYFLLDGRIFSTLVCYLGGILNLPVDTYLAISHFLGIAILALSVMILFKFSIKYLEIENKWVKFLTLLSLYTIIFNHMDIEYLLFPESCVMCAGVLFSVLAAIKYLENSKGSVIKSFILLVISTICYQGLISIFPTLIIVFTFLKLKENTKKTLKIYINQLFNALIMFAWALVISAGLIFIFSNILQNTSNRLERLQNIPGLIKSIIYIAKVILIEQQGNIPKYLSVLVIVIGALAILVIKKKTINYLMKYFIAIFTAYLFSIGPLLAFGYAQARILMSVGAVMGIILLFVTNMLNEFECISVKKFSTQLVSFIVIAYFIFNVTNNTLNGYEHLKAFKLDEQIGAKLNSLVENYEKTSGKEITKLAIYTDLRPQSYEKGIKELISLTERKFAMPWCFLQSINYYCDKKLEWVDDSNKIYLENFCGKDYTEFSEEQIVFVDDTMHMCVY